MVYLFYVYGCSSMPVLPSYQSSATLPIRGVYCCFTESNLPFNPLYRLVVWFLSPIDHPKLDVIILRASTPISSLTHPRDCFQLYHLEVTTNISATPGQSDPSTNKSSWLSQSLPLLPSTQARRPRLHLNLPLHPSPPMVHNHIQHQVQSLLDQVNLLPMQLGDLADSMKTVRKRCLNRLHQKRLLVSRRYAIRTDARERHC
jgi:hypothetical protein